ncbi:MAG TPA: hypothetical protein VH186_36365 [Chloroflexia bacterium]|nr:hypothetical protein [Chloroflexia bacterium]
MLKRLSLGLFGLIFVLFGFLAGNLTSAYGLASGANVTAGTINACVGATPSSSRVQIKMGERPLPPSTLLRVDSTGCTAQEKSLNLSSYANTLLVSANNTPSVNGANLQAAMASVNPTGVADAYLIKLEPGVYDLGNSSLVMKQFVDLEGSGEGITTISGVVTSTAVPVNSGLLVMASNSEVRYLTVDNQAGLNTTAAAIYSQNVNSASHLTHVTANASNGSGAGFGVGMAITNASPLVMDSTFLALGSGSGGSTAVTFNGGTAPTILNSTLKGASGGIIASSAAGTLTIQNSTISGGSIAISASSNTPRINVATSQISGAIGLNTTVKCIFTFKSDFATATNSNCS